MSALFRKLLLLVLGIPFVMIGTRFLLDAAESAYTYQASADWKTGKATLDSVERFSSGDQAFGNQTLVRYQYEMDGQIFSGQFSCVGDECPQENLYETLRMSKEQNNSVAVLINPKTPQDSLLFRNLALPMLFLKVGVGLFCFLTGSAAVIFGVYLLRGQPERT